MFYRVRCMRRLLTINLCSLSCCWTMELILTPLMPAGNDQLTSLLKTNVMTVLLPFQTSSVGRLLYSVSFLHYLFVFLITINYFRRIDSFN